MQVLPPRELPPDPGLRVVRVAPAADLLPRHAIPIVLSRVPAGFPSPADDYVEDWVDLERLLGIDPRHCVFVEVEGTSMTGERILDGDIVLVNRAIEPASNSVVVALLDGELTLKRFVRDERGVRLLPSNPGYAPIEVQEGQDLEIWGVVTFSIHDHRVKRAVRHVARAA